LRVRKRSRISSVLDIAPLIDCVFLLLIFFLLTSSFVEQEVDQQTGFNVNLPGSSFAEALEKEKSLTLLVTAKQEMFISGQKLSFGELEKLLVSKPESLIIKADKNVRLEVITKLMDLAKAHQIANVSIATLIEKTP